MTWVITSVVTWLTVVGIVGEVILYLRATVDDSQKKQVYQLREELDSISDRGYLLQHKIDSLNRLGVAEYPNEEYLIGTTRVQVPKLAK